MSQPRKAMKSLGFQGCCLRCDAPDVGGLKRCDFCIANHTDVRNKMVQSSPDDKLFQHVRELYSMISKPHKYDHDEVHRDELVNQQILAGKMSDGNRKQEIVDLKELFESQKINKNKRILEDLGNKNPWKNNAPAPDIARAIGKETWSGEEVVDVENYGARTIPSKEILKSDRSDRVGEDRVLSDTIEAKIKGKKDINAAVENKKLDRKKWSDVVSDIDDILDGFE